MTTSRVGDLRAPSMAASAVIASAALAQSWLATEETARSALVGHPALVLVPAVAYLTWLIQAHRNAKILTPTRTTSEPSR